MQNAGHKGRMELQLALDMISPEKAMTVASRASDFVDRIEAGTPLLLSSGISVVRQIHTILPDHTLVADTKICDAGARIASAFEMSGASVITIVPAAADKTTWTGVGKILNSSSRNVKLMADLIGSENELEAARIAKDMGAAEICFHLPKRVQGEEAPRRRAVEKAGKIAAVLSIPVYAAGGIQIDDIPSLKMAGVRGIIVGAAIAENDEPEKRASEFFALL